jgi:hypothetical protein
LHRKTFSALPNDRRYNRITTFIVETNVPIKEPIKEPNERSKRETAGQSASKGGRSMFGSLGQGVGVAIRATTAPVALGMRLAQNRMDHPDPAVPNQGWSPTLLSKIALDDFFYFTEFASATIVSLSHRKRLIEEITNAVDFYHENGWIDDPRAYHRTPEPLELEGQSVETSIFGAYRHIRFHSEYEPHIGEPGRDRWLRQKPNRTAHAWLLEHPGKPRPWLICIPGYRMGHPMVDFAGFKSRWLHRELGLNVAIPVMPLHGPRSVGWRGGDGFLSGDFVDTVHAQAQAVWDTRRLIAWLRGTRAETIGAYGVSLGGYTASLLAGIEKDLACVIAGVPATDFVQLLKSHCPPFALRLADRLSFPFEIIEQMLRVISPLAMEPQLEKDRRFIFAGTVDSLAVPGQAVDLWRHWGEPRIEWYQGSHVSFMWEPAVKALVAEALHRSGLISQSTRLPGFPQ